jgi:hypothetical protein
MEMCSQYGKMGKWLQIYFLRANVKVVQLSSGQMVLNLKLNTTEMLSLNMINRWRIQID